MRGEFIGVWSETWREIWLPPIHHEDATAPRLHAAEPETARAFDLRSQANLKLSRALL